MSFTCRAGGTNHTHETATEGRRCYDIHNGRVNQSVDANAQRCERQAPAAAPDKFLQLNMLRDQVIAGHYAVKADDGDWKFYKVDKPKTGRWAGFTFLKVQASDEYWPVKNPAAQRDVYEAILKDMKEAMLQYTKQIGRCAICNRTLTRASSIAEGIGPVCAGKMGL